MLQVYVDSAAAATMECCVCVKLIQCMHEWAFVQMSSDMFGYLVLHTLTHTPPHTCTHTHTLTLHTHPHTSHKVRMQSGTLESFSTRKSSAKFFRQIYSEEGVRGLYRVSVGGEMEGV